MAGESASSSSWLDCFPDDWFSNLDDVGVACGEEVSKFEGGAERGLQHQRFAAPLTEEQVIEARKTAIPKKTQLDTKYCIKVWHEWRNYRNSIDDTSQVPEDFKKLDKKQLSFWLSCFILEVRKQDSSEYPPNTLHHICCGIMRYLRQNGQPDIDFFRDPTFGEFKATLDAEMKRLQTKGVGSKKRQAEPLTEDEEEKLWGNHQLGAHTPQSLVNTIFFMCGVYFALRSGQEHRALRFEPSQIELVEREGERAYLKYTEDLSKNNPGGLKGRKNKPKVVLHHENASDPGRCFVKLFKLYQSKCPSNRPKGAFYLKPLSNATELCWYSMSPIGHHTLSQTVARLCREAGISGFRTNHSLRATTATRLYQAGVDEQLIMERTGHHSVDGVRSYKRTNQEQQENLSDILSLAKKPRNGLSLVQPIQNISNSQQLSVQPDKLQHMFTLNNCSNVNFNINIHH